MHRESCMCGMESLELFQVPPTNIALQESKWMEYYPVASTLNSDTAPIEFDIQGQGDEFIDLSQTYLQVVCKFTKGDGSNLTGLNSNSILSITFYIPCSQKSMSPLMVKLLVQEQIPILTKRIWRNYFLTDRTLWKLK